MAGLRTVTPDWLWACAEPVGGHNPRLTKTEFPVLCVWQVSEAKRMAGVSIVTPDWLWACAERWEKVDERLYPLGHSFCSKSQLLTPLFHWHRQCCGSGMFIPDPNFSYPGSASKNLSILTPKKWFLSSRKYDPGCSSRIRILIFYPSRMPDPGVKKAPDPDPKSRSATLGTSKES